MFVLLMAGTLAPGPEGLLGSQVSLVAGEEPGQALPQAPAPLQAFFAHCPPSVVETPQGVSGPLGPLRNGASRFLPGVGLVVILREQSVVPRAASPAPVVMVDFCFWLPPAQLLALNASPLGCQSGGRALGSKAGSPGWLPRIAAPW